MVTTQQVQELRQRTSASMMDCKRALEEAGGDIDKAFTVLKSKGKLIAEKKSSRTTAAGLISSYIHSNGRVGVLLELRSETDFVSRNPEFSELSHDICLHIAATNPQYVKTEDVPAEVLEDEKKIFKEEFEKIGKPANIVEQMIEGKTEKHLDEICLLRQSFVKNPDMTIKDLVDSYVAKFGENIEIGRFVRYEI